MQFKTKLVPGFAPSGVPILSILGQATFRLENNQSAQYDSEEQLPFSDSDTYWAGGRPDLDPIKLESELVAWKTMTDVIVIGNAKTPRGKKAFYLDSSFQIGEFKKVVRVFGKRRVYITGSGLAFSQAEPFESMPLHYGLAYGGRDSISEEGVTYLYPKNPVGKGFVVKNNVKALQDLELPNLEDPKMLLSPQNLILDRFEKWKDYPTPASFGYLGRNFYPRISFAGLSPEQLPAQQLQQQQALENMESVGTHSDKGLSAETPVLHSAYFSAASSGMSLPYLRGDESIAYAYLDAENPRFVSQMPGLHPKAYLDIGEGAKQMDTVIQSLLIYPETRQMNIIWRAAVQYGGIETLASFTSLDYGMEA